MPQNRLSLFWVNFFSVQIHFLTDWLPTYCLAGIILWGVACKPTLPDENGVVVALQNMQELATTEYTLTKVIKASDDQTWYKIGERKILITCEAQVKAGIDFSKIEARNISKSGKKISLILPPPKVISIMVDPTKVQVAYQDIGFFRSQFSLAEQNNLLQQAEKQIEEKANSLGILAEAKTNAKNYMQAYLSLFGFEEIDIRFDEPLLIEKDK